MALFLSQLTGRTYEDIIALRTNHGLGNIARAHYLVSEGVFESIEEALDAHKGEGGGWGKLYNEAGLHPGMGSLGWAFKHYPEYDKPGHGPPAWAHNREKPGKPDHAGPKDKDE